MCEKSCEESNKKWIIETSNGIIMKRYKHLYEKISWNSKP